MAKLPDPSRIPRQIVAATVEEYTIGSWCPTPDGSGPALAVAIEIKASGLPPLFLRLKSKRAVNDFIAALERHRNDVWP